MKGVKILGINGGPRVANTALLVKEALKAAAEMKSVEIEFVSVSDYKITPCNACRLCYGDVKGIFPDSKTYCPTFGNKDDADLFVNKVKECDGLIIGSPTHEWDISNECKALFSRLRPFCEHVMSPVSGMLRNKPLGAVSTAFDRHGGIEHAIASIYRWGMGLGMLSCPAVTTVPDRGPTTGPFGAQGDVSDSKIYDNPHGILPENSLTSPPTGAVRAFRSARCLGRNVATVALLIRNGFELLEGSGYSIPELAGPGKWPKELIKKGSYMEYLVKQGKVQAV